MIQKRDKKKVTEDVGEREREKKKVTEDAGEREREDRLLDHR